MDTGTSETGAGGSAFFDTSAAVRRPAGRDGTPPAATVSIPFPPTANMREEKGVSAVASSLLHAVGSGPPHLVDLRERSTWAARQPASVSCFWRAGARGRWRRGRKTPRAPVKRIERPQPTASQSFAPEPEPLPQEPRVRQSRWWQGDDEAICTRTRRIRPWSGAGRR